MCIASVERDAPVEKVAPFRLLHQTKEATSAPLND
jgi:hypothetical protein